jgi:hypothetical protein
MKIADVKQRKTVELGRQRPEVDIVVSDLHARSIAPPAPIHSGQLEQYANDGMNWIPVPDMEEIE